MSLRDNPDLASVGESAILLGCARATVFRQAFDGSLPGLVVKNGRRWVSVPRLVAELHGSDEARLEEARARLAEARASHRARLAEARARRSTENGGGMDD